MDFGECAGLVVGFDFVVWLGLLQILLDVCGLELCLVCVLLDLLCGFASCPFVVLLVSVIYVVQLGVWWFGVVVGGLFICLFGVGPVFGVRLVVLWVVTSFGVVCMLLLRIALLV